MAGNVAVDAVVAAYAAVLSIFRFLLGFQFLRSQSPRDASNRETRSESSIKNGGSHPIAVVIPSWQESGSRLAEIVSHLYESSSLTATLDEPSVIIVQAEGGEDVNDDLSLATVQRNHPKLQIVSFPTPSRGGQQNFGAEKTTEPVLLFLHADTLLPAAWDSTIISALSNTKRPTVGAFTLALPEPLTLSLRIMLLGANIRAKYGGLPYGDQAYFITRSTFESVGGFPKVPIMEDVGLLKLIRAANGQVSVLPDRAITSPRRWIRNGVVYNTILNQFLVLAWMAGVSPFKIYEWYYGRPAKME
jgi:hypothetical protein